MKLSLVCAAGPGIAQAAEVQHARHFPPAPPELGLGGQESGRTARGIARPWDARGEQPCVDIAAESVVGVPSRLSHSQPYSLMMIGLSPRLGSGLPGAAARVARLGRHAGELRQAELGLDDSGRDGPRRRRVGACGAPKPLSQGRLERSSFRTALRALPVIPALSTVSFCASQITTLGWFHRSCIHSVYCGRASASTLPVCAPHGKLVLDHQAFLVGDAIPHLGRKADAIAGRIPVHAAEAADHLPHPVLAPRLVAPQRVLEEAIDADVRAAEVIGLAVEHRPLGLRVERETPHAEASPWTYRSRWTISTSYRNGSSGDQRRQFSIGTVRSTVCCLPGIPAERLALGGARRAYAWRPRARCSGPWLRPPRPRREHGHDADLFARHVRHRLHAHHVRRAGKDQLDRIVNARDVADLLEVVAPGKAFRDGSCAAPDADEQLVGRAVALQGLANVEVAGREASRVCRRPAWPFR